MSLLSVVYAAFGILIAGLAAGTIGVSVFKVPKAIRSPGWPQVRGKILSSELEQSDGDSFGPSSYTPTVTYEYQVAGVRYLSDRISFGDDSTSDEGKALDKSWSYATGQHVAVFYDPGRPSSSVLEPGVRLGSVWTGSFVLALGIFMFLDGIGLINE